jgi:pepF/M3 family oligoendopeptidase
MSVIRALASDPDRETRKRAYEAELAAWERTSVPLAAALNSIKYETNVLSHRRGWESPLEAACFNNHIDQATLEAMLSAARASFPDFRRYLRAKAKVVSGAERLPWYDMFAPMGEGRQTWEWETAVSFITEQFGAFSPKMREFAERAFRENWLDVEPRPGKRDGAFCMEVRPGESRILQNYKPSFSGVSTLAHELGHGYHNLCLKERTQLQSGTPMTLAETASIFCETIIREAAFAGGDREDQLAILEATLQSECQVVVDITSRFLFEQRLLEARHQRELSVDELNELMLQSQRETYGDGLDENLLHPYMWAVKGHYYGSTFYNFPYMFGLLFGLGLYASYKESPKTFIGGYDDLLSLTGMSDAVTLGQRFGIDIRQEAFWKSSIAVIVEDIDRFEALVA